MNVRGLRAPTRADRGPIFQDTRTPLTLWFRAIWLGVHASSGKLPQLPGPGYTSFAGRRSARVVRSTLRDPGALRLDPQKPQHLVRREEDIGKLTDNVTASRLVFLVGASGAGKSALVRAGVPKLLRDGTFLPFFFDLSSFDWEKTALRHLADLLFRQLTLEQRTALGIEEVPNSDELGRLFARLHRKLGARPLLIFDQLDDYQLRHRARFVPATTHRWIKPDELVATNAFWAAVGALLQVEATHAHSCGSV